MAYFPPTGSVVAFQSQPSSLLVGASIIGLTPVTLQGINVVSVVGNMNSSVTAFQGTSPWIVNQPSPSIVAYQAAGSILAVNMPSPSVIAYQAAGSILAVSGSFSSTPQNSIIALQLAGSVLAVSGSFSPGNTSVTAYQGGAWSTSITGGYVNVIGSIALGVGNTSVTQAGIWNVNVNSILGTYQEKNAVTASVIGFPILFKIDETNSVLSAVSPQSPLPIKGSITALQGTNPWQVNLSSPSIVIVTPAGSVQAVRTDNASVVAVLSNSSVTALQGTNPWFVNSTGSIAAAVINFTASVAANINVISASIVTNQGTNPWVIGSIVGTYAEDVASAGGDKGLMILGLRNDTVASLVNADLDYTVSAHDSAGRYLIKPFAATETSIYAHASVVNGGDSGSVLVLPGAGTGLRNYITDWAVSNTGSVATLITFTEGGGSVLGRTIAPAGGGSNFPGAMMPIANVVANQPFNMVTTTASSVVYVTVRGYKAP